MDKKELGNVWLGLTKDGANSDQRRWTDGSEFDYNNLIPDQKNAQAEHKDHGKEKECVTYSDATGKWYEHTPCSSKLRFICQINLMPTGGQPNNNGGTLHLHGGNAFLALVFIAFLA